MSGNVLDRRVRKTLQLLQDALAELITEKGYEAVTIQEILDRADVGRSTFYAHFENKDHLLNSILIQLNEVFEQRNRQLMGRETQFEDSHSANLPFKLLQFVEQNRSLFKALLGRQGNGTLNKPVYDFLLASAQQHLKLLIPHGKGDSLKLEMVTHYYVGAFIGVLAWWLEKDLPYSVDDLGQSLKQLAMSGLMEIWG